MKAQEFRSALGRAALSDEEIARRYGVSAREVEEWKSGSKSIPNRVASDFTGLNVALQIGEEVGRRMEAKGLRCGWVEQYSDANPIDLKAYAEHEKSCTVCQERERIARELSGRPPKKTLWERIEAKLAAWAIRRAKIE